MDKDLTTSSIERQNILNNTYALKNIKIYVGLPSIEFENEYWLTKQMVSDFFEVEERTIERYLEKYADELKHKMPTAQFRAMLQELGGIPDMVFQDEEIMGLFEPVIRADFELLETYVHQKESALDVPIHLCLGRDDNISSEEAKAWQNEMVQPLNIIEGGNTLCIITKVIDSYPPIKYTCSLENGPYGGDTPESLFMAIDAIYDMNSLNDYFRALHRFMEQ